MIASLRRAAFAALAGMAVAGVGVSWLVVVALGALGDDALSGAALVRLSVALLVALAGLLALSRVLARRSTGVLERVFDYEDRLVRSIAHEVRNPLSRIVVATDQGLSGDQPADVSLRRISADAGGLDELVGDLLETARVVTGAAPLPQDEVRIDELVAAMPDTTSFPPATTDLHVQPATVTGSHRLIRLAVKNLMRNAAVHGYQRKEGVIEVRVDEGGITVSDRGRGVPADLLSQLRQEHRVDRGQALHGLGLVLATWVSEVHGGRLFLDSREGEGFEARMALPTTAWASEPDGRESLQRSSTGSNGPGVNGGQGLASSPATRRM